jgi:phenylacetic acid degradation protein
MPLYEFEGKRPKVAPSAFINETAVLIGDVEIGENCYIAPNCVLRGDWGKIVIGNQCSVQDCCVIHARPDGQTIVGNRVSIGHASVLHNCTIKDFALVGMNAVVSDWAVVGESSVIGEGCVVRQGQEIPSMSIAVGVPAKVIARLTPEQVQEYDSYKTLYAGLAGRNHRGLKRID